MAFKTLVAFASLATLVVAAAPPSTNVVCPDGNVAPDSACCPFFALRDDLLANLFQGVCGEDAHQAVRLIFHDSIAFSQSMEKQGIFSGGGADGSVLIFPTVEANRAENAGISDGVDGQLPFLAAHPVTAADLVQFAAAVGITNCPGAPRLKFFAGRPNATAPPPEGLVPEPQFTVTQIIDRFADAGNITPDEIVALLSSHSIANADHVDPNIQGVPFDSTQNTFDTQIFLEVLLKGIGFPNNQTFANNTGEVSSPLPIGTADQPGEMRLQSDFALARDPRTACTWQGFVNEQEKMQNAFVDAVDKMSRIGLKNPNALVDCSVVVPQVVAPVTKPATFPATKSIKDVERACFASPFPSLATDPGATETFVAGQVGS